MTRVKSRPHEPAGQTPPWVMPWNAEGLSNESVRRSVELSAMAFRESSDELDPQTVRQDLQTGRSAGLRRRRAIVGLSLLGLCSMGMVSLYQMGLLRHLPDPPLRRFHADKVNASFRGYQYGVPHGALSMTAHALNILLAAIGGRGRARVMPWVPVIAAGKAAAEAGMAAKTVLHQMPAVERAWCSYHLVDAMAHVGTFLLTLPEAWQALRDGPIRTSSRRQP